jgi:hypothetical protein
MSASYYRVRVRCFLRLTLPVCNYADGAGSARPPRSASNVANPTHDLYGDFTLSDFRAVGQAQWIELHEEIKHFFFRAAKQAGITSVSTEKRADLATSMRRPGDIKIGSTRHGWKAASGKTLLIDFTTVSSVCASWVAASSDAPGVGGKGAAAEKTRMVLNSGELSEDQHFLALGFESEGYVPEEAKKLLHAWAKQHQPAVPPRLLRRGRRAARAPRAAAPRPRHPGRRRPAAPSGLTAAPTPAAGPAARSPAPRSVSLPHDSRSDALQPPAGRAPVPRPAQTARACWPRSAAAAAAPSCAHQSRRSQPRPPRPPAQTRSRPAAAAGRGRACGSR